MSELKKLTRLGSDTKKIAALLQAKAPKGHVLAYISPKEAAILKSRGGSGKPHADTGVLSFENELDMGPTTEAPALGQDFAQYEAPATTFGADFYGGAPGAAPAPAMTSGAPGMDIQLSSFPQAQEGAATPAQVTTPTGIPDVTGAPPITGGPEEQGLMKQLAAKTGLKEDTLARLGLAGVMGALGQRTASRAGAAGQAGAQKMQALAQPYQAAGQQLQAQAQRGELTPAAQQSLQAMQAQAAQAAERRGGVGAAQTMQQVEAFRQQLLQQQYDYGLKLSGIGDNIALGAIKTGLQADQQVNQLTNSFYTNMAYIASGMAPGARAGGAA